MGAAAGGGGTATFGAEGVARGTDGGLGVGGDTATFGGAGLGGVTGAATLGGGGVATLGADGALVLAVFGNAGTTGLGRAGGKFTPGTPGGGGGGAARAAAGGAAGGGAVLLAPRLSTSLCLICPRTLGPLPTTCFGGGGRFGVGRANRDGGNGGRGAVTRERGIRLGAGNNRLGAPGA
ncbi:MAG: hypothetical protein CMM48_17560 [Rhodospirillaceae bacterium]|nr:hypothetical protein [Rhodospirillaceae bacterium]